IERDLLRACRGHQLRVRIESLLEPPERRRQTSPCVIAVVLGPKGFRQLDTRNRAVTVRNQIAQYGMAAAGDRQRTMAAREDGKAPERTHANSRHVAPDAT